MPNPYFRFKQFTVFHDRCAMKVTTDSCLFGAWAAAEIQGSELKIESLLDIGAGSGLLSLMVAQRNEVKIHAVEIDREASMQAEENIAASPWHKRITVHHDNILLFQSSEKFDAVICNPPFYENELTSENAGKNIAHHSEELVLSQVVNVIARHLNENGLFFLLLPFKRMDEVQGLLQRNDLYTLQSVIVKQSVSHSPFRVMIIGTNVKPASASEMTVSIWDEHRQYTGFFTSLLKDYYLYL
jgi:tRNA1Val (adenine37-N6)-methyltransferase